MPPPQAIVCHICNGKYFKRSFPIHLKQCEAKWKKTHSRCEYCGSAVANHDWSDHRSHCKPTKKKKFSKPSKNIPLQVPKADHQQLIPTLANKDNNTQCEECETESAVWKCIECEQSLCAKCEVEIHRKGARLRHTRIPINAKALQQENLSVLTQNDGNGLDELLPPKPDANNDARAQCKFCQRRFNPDRVEKHMRICAKAQKKAKKRRVYDGAKRRIEGTVFAEFQYNRSKTPPVVKEWKKHGRRWKEESAQLREIAAINSDLKEIKENDTKDEADDIVIKAPANKPVFRKTESTPTISGISSGSSRRKSLPSKGSMAMKKERPSSNTSNLSLKGTSRDIKRNVNVSKMDKKKERGNDRISRRNSITKKPMIPKFEPKKAGMKGQRSSNMNRGSKPTMDDTRQSIKRKTLETKSNSNVNRMSREKIQEKPRRIQKENNSRNQQQTFKKQKSAASSLSRGIELGVNVNKMFGDAPKTMDDYVERERLRRQQRKKSNGIYKSSYNNNKIQQQQQQRVKPKPKPKSVVPTKKMSRLQIKKEIRIENQPIGGKRSNKPSNASDLASKRAAYFESLLQNPED